MTLPFPLLPLSVLLNLKPFEYISILFDPEFSEPLVLGNNLKLFTFSGSLAVSLIVQSAESLAFLIKTKAGLNPV